MHAAQNITSEVWRPIPSLSNLYEASNCGRIRSVRRKVPGSRGGIKEAGGKVLSQYITKTGYPAVHVSVFGVSSGQKVHRLVAEAFLGLPSDGMQCCHNDGNRLNASASNLRWDSAHENQMDKRIHGTAVNGINHHLAKLTENEVLQIQRLYDEKVKLSEISNRFHISKQHAWRIGKRKYWNHIA